MCDFLLNCSLTPSRDPLLGLHAAHPPRVQEEAVEDDRSRAGLRRGRLPPPVQRRPRDAPEGDLCYMPVAAVCLSVVCFVGTVTSL